MSAPIEEIKGKKKRREKAMELWAAQIFADQARPGAAGQDRSVGAAGGSNFRKEMMQKPGQAKPKAQVAKTQTVIAQDRVESAAPSNESQVETKMKAARQLVNAKTPSPAPPAQQAAEVSQQVAVEANQEVAEQTEQAESSLKEAAETTTPEEVSFSGGSVAAGAAKKAKKAEKSDAARQASPNDEAEESERPQLILPGNSPKAKAYVRASELLGDSPHNPDLDDFLVAL